eukprot:gene5666-1014_t
MGIHTADACYNLWAKVLPMLPKACLPSPSAVPTRGPHVDPTVHRD